MSAQNLGKKPTYEELIQLLRQESQRLRRSTSLLLALFSAISDSESKMTQEQFEGLALFHTASSNFLKSLSHLEQSFPEHLPSSSPALEFPEEKK